MAYRIVYLPDAVADLDKLYLDISLAAGAKTADDFLEGVIAFIYALEMFPARGTVRDSRIPGLRIIGYRRSISVAFSVRGDDIVILGVFRRGQNISDQILEGRLV
ncbi:ParE toxin of type II toxin-antitoxin system, parDE [Rhizobium sp. NFR07]|uniref:type II toxin-antitoxin system RelE/ParE family toxin n=1 Tax=Rhizobium sp. NFR07 TaxID=1566262 RepID=UPI0008DFA075|nr:type II toxin-antitoxin system RelE/ParE family toxin [Rhizobium sp. NFR07]SFB02807.1 ParE toxin of type II toxin-antitoxin system, parDE [Rhizobium sp. NFR07]